VRRRDWALLVTLSACVACGHGSSASPSRDGGTGAPVDSGGAGGPGDAEGPGEAGVDGGCIHGPFPSPDIYDSHCAFDRAAYMQLAGAYSSAQGLSYRFGADSTYYHASQALPTQPQAQVKLCGNGPIPGPPSQLLLYQLGNDCMITQPGNYSSDEGLVIYDSDDPPAPVDGGMGVGGGVDNIQIEYFAYNVFFFMPSPAADFGTDPYAGQLQSASWTALAGGPVHSPITVARGIAPSFGQTSQVGFVAFNDGLIGTIGCNTEPGGYVTSLPSGMVPTSMGMTNGNEFLLVTLWDTTTTTGKLAVYSIEADHAGLGDFDDTYYDFHAHLPGFPSTGNATTMKLLGMIDLPGMIAPTDIAVASNYQSAFFLNNGANADPANLDLTNETVWQSFTGTGDNTTQRSTAGFAVIASRSERKVAFVDLQPLFDFFNATYFTSFATFQMTQSNWGPAPGQWPFTFDAQPAATPPPVVVSTISLDQIPTALFAGRTGEVDPAMGINALVATMDGTLHVYSLGGLIDATAASANAISEIGTVAVGNNPTNIAIRKAGSASVSQPDPVSGKAGNIEGQQVFVVARGDRAINLVYVTGATGTVLESLQDSRLMDPVSVDDADHESFLSYVLDVADLKGRQVVSYRYGPITFPSDMSIYPLPMGPDGGPTFEYGGSYGVQGTPFQVSGTNVP